MTEQEPSQEGERRVSPDEAVRQAILLHRSGDTVAAEEIYEKVLEVVPDHPDALHWLGVLRFHPQRPDETLELIGRSVELVPDHPDYYNNLGNVLQSIDDYAGAEQAYRRCLELKPKQTHVWCNLGVCLRRDGRTDEAVEAFETALTVDPGQPDACHALAELLLKFGNFEDAVSAYMDAIAAQPKSEMIYQHLARLFYASGRIDEAGDVYRRWAQANPEHPLPRHNLAGCTGEGVPARTESALVRLMFDSFADTFDEVLARLDYRTPELIGERVAAALGEPRAVHEVLDIGCGTGLCGASLKPYARALTGVDLSPAMLEKARGRGVYDALREAELVAYLASAAPDSIDLIVCADTLCYFGDLRDVCRAAQQALRPNGRFIFSVESADADEDVTRWRLHPHGRYAHTSAYVRDTLAEAGLRLEDVTATTLRQELGRPVAGCVFTAQRNGADAAG